MDPADVDTVRNAIAQQGAWLGQQDSQLSATAREVEGLTARLTELTTQMDRLRLESRRPNESEPHITNPPTYDGDPGSCRSFLSQCSLVFSLQPRRFTAESTRVAFVITLLTGRAREWATAVWDTQAPCCHSFEDFKTEMMRLFDRSAQGEAAAARLVRLKQGDRTVTDFSVEFQTLSTACGWNDAALRAQFLEGLRDDIQDEITVHEIPRTLDSLVELALRIESRMLYRCQRQSLRHRVFSDETVTSVSHSNPVNPAVPSEPMQLGRMRLTPKERERRLSNGLCLYCGRSGHLARSCPLKANAHR